VPRKRHTYPAKVLADLITALEVSDVPIAEGGPKAMKVLRGYHAALLDVLSMGPVLCIDAWLRESAHQNGTLTPDETLLLRAELLQLFRSAVRQRESGQSSSTIWLQPQMIGLTVRVVEGGRVNLALDAPVARELVLLQVMMLLQEVGLVNVRQCAAPGCGRLFVKTYRREFCSVQCQKRINARKQRHQAREKRERQARARRLRKGQS
jgi:CGNR zinc finger